MSDNGNIDAEEVLDNAAEVAEDVVEAAGEIAEDVAEAAGEIAEDVADSEAVEAAGEMAGDAAEAAGDVAEDIADSEVVEAAGEMAEDAVEAAGDVAEDIADSEAVEAAGEIAEEVGEEIVEGAEDAAEAAGDVAEDIAESEAVEAAGEMAEEVGEEIAEGAEAAVDAAGEIAEDIAESEAVEAAGEMAEEVGEEIVDGAEAAVDAAGDVAEDIADSEVVEAAGEMAGDAAEAAGELAEDVGDAVAPAAAVAVAAAGTAVAAGMEGASNIGSMVVESEFADTVTDTGEVVVKVGSSAASSVGDFLESDVIGTIKNIDWDPSALLSYNIDTDKLYAMGAGLANAGRAAFDFIKFDIFRDFFQVIGLFFAGIEWPSFFSATVGWFARVAAFDWSGWIASIPNGVYFMIAAVAALSGVILFWCRMSMTAKESDRVEDGLEVTNWEDRGSWTLKTTKWMLTIMTTLYLPVSKYSLQVLTCHPDFAQECQTGYMTFLAIIMLIVVTLIFPCQVYSVIQREQLLLDVKPFDDEGNPREITDEMYQEEVKKSSSPYAFLFKGYEQKWAYYKVIMMVFKFLLALPLVLFVAGNNFYPNETDTVGGMSLGTAAMWCTIGVLALYSTMSFYASPFVNRSDDWMDASGRVAALSTAVIGLLVVTTPAANVLWDLLLTVINILNIIIMVSLTLFGGKKFAGYVKKWTKTLDFTVDKNSEGKVPLLFSSNLSLPREKKIRVWQPFWDALLLTSEEFAVEKKHKYSWADTRDTPSYLKNFGGTVCERHVENKYIVADVGAKEMYRAARNLPAEVVAAQAWTVDNLIGLDVFLDDDKGGATKFGKLYVVPFPFTAVVYYDCGGHVVLSEDRMVDLVNQNQDEEILRRKGIRHQLRGIQGKKLVFHYECELEITRMEERTNSQGETERVPVKEMVHFTFEHGYVSVGQNSGPSWEDPNGKAFTTTAGFSVSLNLVNGKGRDSTGKEHTKSHSIGGKEIGMTPTYEVTPNFEKMMYSNGNDEGLEERVAGVLETFASYRAFWRDQFVKKTDTLTYHFWAYIYNMPGVPRDRLELWLQKYERNELVQAIPSTHVEGLNQLYARLNALDSHPCFAYWFTYWHDAWENNNEISSVKEQEELLDPKQSKSLAYKPIGRPELVKKLKEADEALLDFWKPEELDRLYYAMDCIARGEQPSTEVPEELAGKIGGEVPEE